jgi:hypothetical protein
MLLALDLRSPESNFDLIESYTGKPVGEVPPLDNRQRLGQFTQSMQSFLSVSASMRIGFTGFGSFSGSTEHKVWFTDYGVSATVRTPNSTNGVESWTYGAGYRVGILMDKTISELRAGMSIFAAEGTLNHAKMMIQILVYGIPMAPPIPISELSDFDVEAYGKYMVWQTEIAKLMAQNRDQLDPILTHAAVKADFDLYINRLAPVLFALRRLEDRDSFKDAREDGLKRGKLDEIVLRTFYAKLTGEPQYLAEGSAVEMVKVSEAAAANAKNILSWYDQKKPG